MVLWFSMSLDFDQASTLFAYFSHKPYLFSTIVLLFNFMPLVATFQLLQCWWPQRRRGPPMNSGISQVSSLLTMRTDLCPLRVLFPSYLLFLNLTFCVSLKWVLFLPRSWVLWGLGRGYGHPPRIHMRQLCLLPSSKDCLFTPLFVVFLIPIRLALLTWTPTHNFKLLFLSIFVKPSSGLAPFWPMEIFTIVYLVWDIRSIR